MSLQNSNVDAETSLNWLNLDDTSWHEILSYLDSNSLLKASGSCKKFQEVLSSSTKLLHKIKLHLKFPEIHEGSEIEKIKSRLQNHSQLTRRYQNLEIIRLRDEYLNHSTDMRRNFTTLIGKVAVTAKLLKVENSYILRDDLISLLKPFTNLTECSLISLMLSDDVAETSPVNYKVVCPNLKTLKLVQCDFFALMLFDTNDQLEVLEVSDPSYIRADVEVLESFLFKQTHLKELTLKEFRFNSSYSTNRLATAPFQLKFLSLSRVSWDIGEHCEMFIKSQRSLEVLKLQFFYSWMLPRDVNYARFCRIMQHFFSGNRQLKSVAINTKNTYAKNITDIDFLPGVVNNKVEDLTYVKDGEDKTELMKIFTRIFPQVKRLKFCDTSVDSSAILENIRRFTVLESLDLRLTPKSLDFNLGQNGLKSFKFIALNEDKSAEKLNEIFVQNPLIKNVSLNIEPMTVEEITGLFTNLSSALETLCIHDLHLTSTEAELFIQSFPHLCLIQSDVALQPEVVQILTAASIKFELTDL